MKNTFSLALIFLAICTMFSCTKESKVDCQSYIHINEDVAMYIFNDSSYWIYQNASTLEIDSQVVFSSKRYTSPAGYPGKGCPTPLNYNWYASIEQHINGQKDSFLYMAKAPYKLYIYKYNGSIKITEAFDLDLPVGQNTDSINFLQQLSSLTIKDSTYFNVSVFHIPMDIQPVPAFPYEMDLYFAPNVGLIRKVEYNTPIGTQTWDLIRYRTTPIPDNKYQ